MSKFDKFFEEAKSNGIKESELFIRENKELSFSLFHGEIVSFSNNSQLKISARGLVGSKFGAASSDVWSNEKCHFLVQQIKENGSVIEDEDPAIIFAGAEKYKKIKTYSKELSQMSVEEKIEIARKIEEKIKSLDSRIVEVEEVGFEETEESVTIQNSLGLKLNQKTNYCVFYAGAVASENGQVKSGFDLYFDSSLENFDIDDFAEKVVEKAVSQLGGEPCETGKYKVVLEQSVVASLLSAYLSNANASSVQKKSSQFIGKLGEAVASSKLTVEELPHAKTVFARTFDDEGVPTYNKKIIEKGKLKTYIYSLTSAKKDNVESTGNGFRRGPSVSEGFTLLSVNPGKLTTEEIFQKIGNGVYITSIAGLHAGLNPMSGNFSLQSSGFLIKDGKKDRALDIITISGNLAELFMNIEEVGKDVKLLPYSIKCPPLLIKSLSVSGK